MIEPLYSDFDGMPSRYNVREAWVYHRDKNAWVEIDRIAHRKVAFELGKIDFDHLFPGAPPLPPEAFASRPTEPYYGDWNWAASRWNEHEAWIFHRDRNAWGRINLISHSDVHELSKEDFDRCYPNVPPLPPEAFAGK